MAGVQADAVTVLIEAKTARYLADMEAAAKKTEEVFKRIRAQTAKPVKLPSVQSGSSDKEAQSVERNAQRKVAAEEKASARIVAAAEKAAAKEIELSSASASAAEAAAARKVAAEEAAQARIAAVIERTAARASASIAPVAVSSIGAAAGSRSQAANQSRLMAGTSLSSGNTAGLAIEQAINQELADQVKLRASLVGATDADTTAIRDQLFLLKQINDYKKAGLAETEAIAAADADLIAIETRRTAQLSEQTALQQKQLQSQIAANGAKVSSGISGIGASIIGVASIAEISHLNDEYIKFSNSLKIAGVSTSEFDTIQGHLLATATRTGSSIGALGDLFRSTSLASHDLGASQSDILKVTDAVANSLRITGASGGAARAAILQLGHTFESTRVTAREFNSLQLNAYPILQAVAAGSDKYGGSVAKLRKELIDTGISNKEFFQDLLNGAHILEGPASKAILTTGQGFSALNSALTVYFGSADQAQGVSATFGKVLGELANNLDILIPAIAAVGAALISGFIVRAGAAAIAAKGLGGAISAAFGGPVGIAITAVTLAIADFAIQSNTAENAAKTAEQGLAALEDQYGKVGVAGHGAAAELRGVGDDALSQITKINGFSGAIQGLTGDLLKQAAAARLARVELLDKQIADSKSKESTNFAGTGAGQDASADAARAAGRRGNVTALVSGAFGDARSRIANLFSGGENNANYQRAFEAQARQTGQLERERNRVSSLPLTSQDLPGGELSGGLSTKSQKALTNAEAKLTGLRKIAETATGKRLDNVNAQIKKAEARVTDLKGGIDASAAGAGAGGRGRTGKSDAERAEDKRKRLADQFDQQKANLNDQLLSVQGKQAKGIEDTYASEVAQADAENAKRKEHFDQFNDAQQKELNAKSDAIAAQQKITAALERTEATTRQNAELEIGEKDAAIDTKQAQLTITLGRAARAKLEDEILDLKYEERRLQLEANKADAIRNKDKVGEAKATADLANLPVEKSADAFQNKQERRSPYEKYRADLNDTDKLSDEIDNIKIEVLDHVADSLANATTKALGLTGALGDIVGQIIKIGIQRKLIGPLADSLFGKADGSSGGSIGSVLSGLFKSSSGGRASGGDVSSGKIYRINENGPEYFQPAMSGKIIPTGRAASSGGNMTIMQNISVDGRNSVTPAGFASDILNRANQFANRAAANAGKAAYNNSPQRSQKLSQLGS